MAQIDKTTMSMITANLICAAAAWVCLSGLIDTEFGGGTITGPLIDLSIAGSVLFVFAALLAHKMKEIAFVAAMLATFCCLPLYLYRLVPAAFQKIIPGDYSVDSQGASSIDTWALLSISYLLVSVYVDLRRLGVLGPADSKD